MKTGDKVRLLHAKGEGIIRKIVDNKLVEVEIEDGFIIPILKAELVVVHSEESSIDDRTDAPEKNHLKNTGLYLAFVPFNDKTYSMFLINGSFLKILFTAGEEKEGTYSGVMSGELKPGNSVKIKEYLTTDFDFWPEIIIQSLYFKEGRAS
ncbi:MAG: DUF2027 domain-containing protein [Cytophagaceae bacterium]|nr:DUF2027 domain-containing protein [Cytophagaceae bacterium]